MLQRVLTALVGIPILVAAIWWGAPWLTLVVAVAAVLGIREFYRLLPPGVGPLSTTLGALWVIALVLGGQVAADLGGFLRIAAGILLGGAFVALLWFIAFYSGRRYLMAGLYLFGGPVYIGFLLTHALALREVGNPDDLGRSWLLFALLVSFATDTGAFFTGRVLGRHPMAPGISPNKTWEGAVGGFLLAVLASLALGWLLGVGAPYWQQAVIGATVGVAAQGGDLFESKLKRISNVKDTGSIIPGHGGILDRLDSIVVSVPAVYYLLTMVFEP